jgi:FKBP-type peptidyl-prolyl cis-trans isomerase (trigger factor)
MGLLENVVSGAVGYGIASARKSNALTELIDQKINSRNNNKTLRDVVEEYAKSRGIYTQNNQIAHELHKLAEQYEEYDYDRYY